MSKLRVLVLDDSIVCRAQLKSFLEHDGDIEVVDQGASGEDVVTRIERHRVELLVVDLQMPRMGGHETISAVMSARPIPILVVTGTPLGALKAAVFESIRRGALDLFEKPEARDAPAQARLRQTVRRLAHVPVVRHVAGRLAAAPASGADQSPGRPTPPVRSTHSDAAPPAVIGIASSAGGPLALATLVSALSLDVPASILIVQHLPTSFARAFVEFLANRTSLRVEPVLARMHLRPGTVYTVGGDTHLGLASDSEVAPIAGEHRSGHRPSADVMFESLARHAGERAAGVVLSGMGEDGAVGLRALRKRGGLCLAQDQKTAVVWGMPRAALELGGAEAAHAPPELARRVEEWAWTVTLDKR